MAKKMSFGAASAPDNKPMASGGLSSLLSSKSTALPEDFKDFVRKAPHSDFAPDPTQPAKRGPRMSEESLGQLGKRIQRLGQLVPLKAKLNNNPEIDAKYLIEDGERRWRAIGLTAELSEVQFILNTDTVSPVDFLINQITVNNEREQPICADNAEAYARVVAELKEQRQLNQKQIAQELGLPESDLTKYMAISKASDEIKDLSFDDITQDLQGIYLLGNLQKKDKQVFEKTIKAIREGKFPGTVRSFVSKVIEGLKRGAEKSLTPKPLKCHTVKELKLLSSQNDQKTIEVTLGTKKMQMSFSKEQLLSLID